jgi:coupling of ubiquitin conjugation to ER degradation protein 1
MHAAPVWLGNADWVFAQAPPSFQPPITFAATNSTPTGSSSSAQARKNEIDLITRYNLQSKISGKGKEKEEESPAPGWQQDKAERAKMLQRRRDEMILAARRKMQEKDAATGGSGAESPGSVVGSS